MKRDFSFMPATEERVDSPWTPKAMWLGVKGSRDLDPVRPQGTLSPQRAPRYKELLFCQLIGQTITSCVVWCQVFWQSLEVKGLGTRLDVRKDKSLKWSQYLSFKMRQVQGVGGTHWWAQQLERRSRRIRSLRPAWSAFQPKPGAASSMRSCPESKTQAKKPCKQKQDSAFCW